MFEVSLKATQIIKKMLGNHMNASSIRILLIEAG